MASRALVRIASLLACLALVGCEEGASLVVDLRTDLSPGLEFVRVRTEYSTEPFGPSASVVTSTDRLASDDADYVNRGDRVAELDSLRPGTAYVRVSLLDERGRAIVDRITSVEVQRRVAIVVVISRACRNVTCPGPSDSPDRTTCLAGRCVPPECTLDHPELCGDPSCTTDADCLPDDPCAVGICSDRECFFVGVDSRCPPEQWCNPDVGCVPRPGFGDAGVGDAGSCAETEVCTGGEDDDCDGLTDCADPDCDAQGCDDGSLCTENDVCEVGECRGASIMCDDVSPCTDDACDPAIGCVFSPVEGTCDDGSLCTENDVCVDGTCQGTALDCDDANGCTDEVCDPAVGCVWTNNTASCDDTFWCNGPDTCVDGACAGHPSPPCATFCNETTEACTMCLVDADCGTVTRDAWPACNPLYSGDCDNAATRQREVRTPRCTSGMCTVERTMETDTTGCNRNTNGDSCGAGTTVSSCSYTGGACDETGSRTRTVRRCMAGSCTPTTSTESCGGRNTNGDLCGMRRTRDRCCGGSCRDIWTSEAHCGGCGISCGSGMSCRVIHAGATAGDGAACFECTASSMCGGGSSRNCWSVATGGYGYCQCLSNAGCAAGQTCFTGSGTNYCRY